MKRRVLVTGASKGIGKAIAIKLSLDGFEVVVHYGRDEVGAHETLGQIKKNGGDGQVLQFDLADLNACREAIENNIQENGSYYGVVCNAGISRDGAFPALTDEDWFDVVNVNLNGFYHVLKPCVMPMVRAKQGGRIVTLSSVSGMAGNRGQVNYSATKAGIIGATKALALELAKRNITVNCVAPGLIDTDMVSAENFEHAKDMIPLRRMGKPEEVACLVSYLMSDSAGYVTRQVISINGGLV